MIYKRPGIYKSSAYRRYGVNAGGIGVYKLPYGTPQEWTNQNVPAGVETLHDFGDGLGPVPAVPVDACGVRNDITGVITYPVNTDACGVRNDITGVITYPVNTDACGVRNDIISIELIE